MKLTIILEDNAVYKDRISFNDLDLSFVPANVRALQFNDETNTGHIEFTDSHNENISKLPDWAIEASVKWDEAKVQADADLEKSIEILKNSRLSRVA